MVCRGTGRHAEQGQAQRRQQHTMLESENERLQREVEAVHFDAVHFD